jgi:hypothetical protein
VYNTARKMSRGSIMQYHITSCYINHLQMLSDDQNQTAVTGVEYVMWNKYNS